MIINLTPHPVVIFDGGPTRTIPASGNVARLACDTTPTGDIDGIPVVVAAYGAAGGIPAPRDGVTLIVSLVTALAAPGRNDLVVPHGEIRDNTGRIIGVRALARVSAS